MRDATVDDLSTIVDYNCRLAKETEDKTLDTALITPGVAAMLADPGKGRYWIAAVDGEIAGQIGVTYEWSDWRNATLWWIQSVYVSKSHRRQGVYSAMYAHLKSLIAQDDSICGLRLYVEKENTRAQATYRSLGMGEPRYWVMQDVKWDGEQAANGGTTNA